MRATNGQALRRSLSRRRGMESVGIGRNVGEEAMTFGVRRTPNPEHRRYSPFSLLILLVLEGIDCASWNFSDPPIDVCSSVRANWFSALDILVNFGLDYHLTIVCLSSCECPHFLCAINLSQVVAALVRGWCAKTRLQHKWVLHFPYSNSNQGYNTKRSGTRSQYPPLQKATFLSKIPSPN